MSFDVHSMTGFGEAKVSNFTHEIHAVIKSINHRFCEVRVKSNSQECFAIEQDIQRRIQEKLKRGKIDVIIELRTIVQDVQSEVQVYQEIIEFYKNQFQKISDSLKIPFDVTLRDYLSLPLVIRQSESLSLAENVKNIIFSAIDLALEKVESMRLIEGENLQKQLLQILEKSQQYVLDLKKISVNSKNLLREKLKTRIAQLQESIEIPSERFEQEVLFLLEKIDVSEEIIRLTSHLQQFQEIIESSEPKGKKMDFLVQEILRETNTIGSKAFELKMKNIILELKYCSEQLREQIQNIV